MEFSVRFFKRVFLVVLVLLIVIPLFFAIWFGISNTRALQRNMQLEEQLKKTQEQLSARLMQPFGAEDGGPEGPAYQALYPELRCETSPDKVWVRAENTVYLTFDDGPSANTKKLLDVLDNAGVKATFFVTGQSDTPENRALIREISERGHMVGIHTYTHDYLNIYASVENFLKDVNATYNMIYEASGIKPEIFRFPGGSVNSYNQQIYQELVAEMLRRGFVFYDWNASGEDTMRGATAETITQAALSSIGTQTRGILLLHDAVTKPHTIEALPGIIAGLKAKGYSFEPLTPVVLPIMFSYNTIKDEI